MMIGTKMMEWRRHPRIREEIPVRWSMPKTGVEGRATLRNVSISGMMLEVDEQFKVAENTPFQIEILDSKLTGFIPREARVVWSSDVMVDKRRRFCGLKFVDPTGPAFSRLKEHVEGRLDSAIKATDMNILNRYLYQSN
jgi:hypothetical protein